MRFIGSKAALLDHIQFVIDENTTGQERVFCDLFSGTAAVAKHFKQKYQVISNDFLHFSYVLQRATVENNHQPRFEKLKAAGIRDPFAFLEETPCSQPAEDYFISRNYAPYEGCDRMYISPQNAMRIDFIRHTIESWKQENLLTEDEYYYLLAGLIEGVPYISNITGTYGAYLKEWDKRAYKEFEMIRLDVQNNGRQNKAYNTDANHLISQIQGDILYLDPPYNARQYASNYHLLETISRYDYPQIKGVTGIRDCSSQRSAFCIKKDVRKAFEDIIEKANFEHIILSYSNEGLMDFAEIEEVLKKHGQPETFKRYDIPYRKYKSKINKQEQTLYEYLFYIRKKVANRLLPQTAEDLPSYSEKPTKIFKEKSKKYVKSPLNYIGGKYKILSQILPHFPADMDTFVDLFSGGANVGINVAANKIICNDINTKIIEMFVAFKSLSLNDILQRIDHNIQYYGLSKTNEAGFIRFREQYNRNPHPIDLYTLACYSFNYQFRFNNQHQYNNPFGRDRSQFSDRMRENLIAFVEKLKNKNIEFCSKDFTDVDLSCLGPQDFVYCDPPYLITTGSYNDGNRGFKDWGPKEEQQLYALLDALNDRNVRFALSNVFVHKGQRNEPLIDWSRKYTVIHLNSTYANSSYNTRRGDSDEVLITNY